MIFLFRKERALLLSLVFIGLPTRSFAQDTTALSGCFRFDRPYFSWDGYRNAISGRPESTSVVELSLRSHLPFDSLTKVLTLRPIPSAVDSFVRRRWLLPSHWDIRPSGMLELIWTNGFTGARFTLSLIGDTLRGPVRFLSHQLVTGPAAPSRPPDEASAVRIRCPSS